MIGKDAESFVTFEIYKGESRSQAAKKPFQLKAARTKKE